MAKTSASKAAPLFQTPTGRGGAVGESAPPNLDVVIWLAFRLPVYLLIILALAYAPLRGWADHFDPPLIATQLTPEEAAELDAQAAEEDARRAQLSEADRAIEDGLRPAGVNLARAIRWLDTSGLDLLLIGGGALAMGALALELGRAAWLIVAGHLTDAGRRTISLRIRTLRPQSRTSRTDNSPLDLLHSLHATLIQASQERGGRQLAMTLSAKPEEPITLGAVVSAPPLPGTPPAWLTTVQGWQAAIARKLGKVPPAPRPRIRRNYRRPPLRFGRLKLEPVHIHDAAAETDPLLSFKRLIDSTIIGSDVEALVDSVPDSLAEAMQPGRYVVWQELRLLWGPQFPLRTLEDAEGEMMGPLLSTLRTRAGVMYTEMQFAIDARDESALLTRWRRKAQARRVDLRKKQVLMLSSDLKALEAKLHDETFAVTVRLVVVARDEIALPAAQQAIREMTGAFGQYQMRAGIIQQKFIPAGLRPLHVHLIPGAAPEPKKEGATKEREPEKKKEGAKEAWWQMALRLARQGLRLGGVPLVGLVGGGALGGLLLAAQGFLGGLFLGIGLSPWVVPAAGAIGAVLGFVGALGRLILQGKPTARVTTRGPRLSPPSPVLLPWRPWAPPALLSSTEFGSMWHLPSVEMKTLIAWLPNRYLPAQPHAFIADGANDRIVLGYARRSDGTEAPVGPSLRALRQVLHLTAGMGAGKSRALANIAKQLIPNGFILMDGKGDDAGCLAETVRLYLPIEVEHRLMIVDPIDADWPIGLNPFYGINLNQAGGTTQALGLVMAILMRLDAETMKKSMGMIQYMQMAVVLIVEGEPAPTFASLKQALEDEGYRAKLLPKCTNIEVKNFWENTFPNLSEQQKNSLSALVRRFDNLMVDETMRYLLTQPVPTVDFLNAMENGAIVLAPMPHRKLGGQAEFIGMLILQTLMRAAFQRGGNDQTRETVPLLIDELQVFVGDGESKDLSDAVTQLRGFGIASILAHQTLAQLEGKLLEEVMGNAANRMILRTQGSDAKTYASLFPTTDLTESDIVGQNPHEHQYLVIGGGLAPAEVCSIRPLGWPSTLEVDKDLPPYAEGDWREKLPPPLKGGPRHLDKRILQMVYGSVPMQHVADELSQAPEWEWRMVRDRWETIRAYQRQYILDHPQCIPNRIERQRWLSRLWIATPRIFAAVAYQRQRWLVAPGEKPAPVKDKGKKGQQQKGQQRSPERITDQPISGVRTPEASVVPEAPRTLVTPPPADFDPTGGAVPPPPEVEPAPPSEQVMEERGIRRDTSGVEEATGMRDDTE